MSKQRIKRLLAKAADLERNAARVEAESPEEVAQWWAKHHRKRGVTLQACREWHASIGPSQRREAADIRWAVGQAA